MFTTSTNSAVRVRAIAGLALLVSFSAQASSSSLNIPVFNQMVGKLVSEVLVETQGVPNPFVQALELKLDAAGTDLSSDDRVALKLDASATVSRTRWAPQSASSVGLSVSGSADRLKQEAEFVGSVVLKTDTIALARFLAKEIETDWCRAGQTDAYDADGKFQAATCAEIKKLQVSANIRELMEGVARIGLVQIDYIEAKIASLDQLIKQGDPTKLKRYESELKRAREDEKMMERIGRELARALVSGSANTVFDLTVKDLTVSGFGDLRDLHVYLDKGQLQVSLGFRSGKIKDIDSYFQMKPIAEQYLLSIQNGDPSATKEIKELAKFLVGFVEQALGK